MTDDEESSVTEENVRVLKMPFGIVHFDPPRWVVEFSPTSDEWRRFDRIEEKLKDPSIGDAERNALLAEKESIIEMAQRPSKHISGCVHSKPIDSETPDDINYYQLYHEHFG